MQGSSSVLANNSLSLNHRALMRNGPGSLAEPDLDPLSHQAQAEHVRWVARWP